MSLLAPLGLALLLSAPSGLVDRKPEAAVCLRETAGSPEEAVVRFLHALAAADSGALKRQVLSAPEFEGAVWPWLDSSRPETNLTAGFVWEMYSARNDLALARLLEEHGGRPLELIRIESGSRVRDFRGFQLVEKPLLLVRDPAGETRTVRLFGSILSQDGRFKIYGFKKD